MHAPAHDLKIQLLRLPERVALDAPVPGSLEERARFAALQRHLTPLVAHVFPDRHAAQQGVVFHLIGALSEYGKLGTVCIGDSHASAEWFFHNTVAVLNRETGSTVPERGAYPMRMRDDRRRASALR